MLFSLLKFSTLPQDDVVTLPAILFPLSLKTHLLLLFQKT